MSLEEENKAIARRHFEELWARGALAVADEIYAPTCIGHCGNQPDQTDYPASEKQLILRDRAFSREDPIITVEDQIAERDRVLTRWTCRATHTEEVMGLPPTGREVRLTGMHVHRIADGKIVEVWAIDDFFGLMQQLGVIPAGLLGSAPLSAGTPAGVPREDGETRRGLRPYSCRREEGDPLWFFGSRTWIRASGAQTGGAYALVEHLIPPSGESPFHVHHDEDEHYYVVEGEMTFYVGDQQIAAPAGTHVFGPREIPHGFRAQGTAPARLLLEATPAGFDRFVLALSEPARGSGFPPPGPPDLAVLMATAAEYHMEILGPLPS